MYPDSQQLFVGNLPHNCTESDLESLFSQFGKVIIIGIVLNIIMCGGGFTFDSNYVRIIYQVAEIRINSKGVAQSKIMPSGQRVPNFGFVVFETDAAVQECLKHTPVHLPDGHRLNVETKKNNKVCLIHISSSIIACLFRLLIEKQIITLNFLFLKIANED